MQRTYRMPKEIRVEPQKFAAELIHRLEAVQRTREAEEKLEERLKRVRMVSGPESGMPCTLRFLSCFITASGPESLSQGLPEPTSSCLTMHWVLTCFDPSQWLAKACSPVTPASLKPPVYLIASVGCVPGRRSLWRAPKPELGEQLAGIRAVTFRCQGWGSCSNLLREDKEGS